MPNAKVLESKKAVVEALTGKIKEATSVVFVDYKGITVAQDNITITNDFNYAVDFAGKEDEGIIYVGTNATVTFYTALSNGTLIPVATAKIVVEGDLNGDGVLDVLDANIAQLASTEHAELDRCYYLAANLNADTGITANDYSAVVNKALA